MKLIWKTIWPELMKYRAKLAFVMFLGFFVSAVKGMLSPLIQRLVDVAWSPTSEHPEWAIQIPMVFAVMWLMMSTARYFHLFGMKYIADTISVKLRRDLMDKYLSLNLGFFHSFSRGSGGLISRMLNDIQIIQDGTYKVADVVREPFMLIFALSFLVYLDWKLTLFIMLILPIITGVARRLARSLRKYSRHNQEAMEDLTKTLKESLDGTRIVQSFNLEGEMRRRFGEEAAHFLGTRKKIIGREEAAGPISESLVALAMSAIFVYIGKQVISGDMTTGGFTAFLAAATFLQDAAKKLQGGYIKLQQAGVAIERMSAILNSDNKVSNIENPKKFPSDWETIEYKNVSFSYDDELVLNNIDLSVKRGEIIALVGASGGGKSTLVNLLERFFDPTEGQISIGGTSITDVSIEDLRDNVALVSQDVFLFSDTIERNIHMGNLSKDPKGIVDAAKIANAHSFIEKTEHGYQTQIGDMGAGFSGGEKQRISIARAVFKDAPILILDEATSALDSQSEKEVQEGLEHLMQGRTAFVIAHRLSTIVKADRILVLKNGHIVEQGNHEELMAKKAEYHKYHQLQQSL